MDSDFRECLMRFAVLQKFIQCLIFREELLLNKNKLLVFKQPTFNSEEATFGGISTASRLVTILKPSSLACNNVMGKILMEHVTKIVPHAYLKFKRGKKKRTPQSNILILPKEGKNNLKRFKNLSEGEFVTGDLCYIKGNDCIKQRTRGSYVVY